MNPHARGCFASPACNRGSRSAYLSSCTRALGDRWRRPRRARSADPLAPLTTTPGIVGVGAALPDEVVENARITPLIGVSDEWIVKRTGIHSRRYAQAGANLADLASAAAEDALRDARLDASEIDLVLVASCSQDSVMPNAAPIVAHAIGAGEAGAFDVGSACTGFIAALAAARGILIVGGARNALVIGAEIMSRHVDPHDRNTAALFGDGAGAVVCARRSPPARSVPSSSVATALTPR